MDDDQKVAFIKLRIGDTPANPLYPMFTDEEYILALQAANGNVDTAVSIMAISASILVGSVSTREVIDDLTIENQFAPNYMKALNYLISNPVAKIPPNLMPWTATKDCDRVKLMDVADLSCEGQAKVRAEKAHSACGC
ncbi:hypothetical protein D3C78_1263390 [compost metagenome]